MTVRAIRYSSFLRWKFIAPSRPALWARAADGSRSARTDTTLSGHGPPARCCNTARQALRPHPQATIAYAPVDVRDSTTSPLMMISQVIDPEPFICALKLPRS